MCLSVLHDFLAQALDLLKLEPSMGKRDTGRWLVYGNSLPSLPEVGEPYAGKPHVRICAGGREVTRVPTANIMVVRARAAPNPRLRYPQFQCSGLDRRRLLSGRYQHL
jgi:hypothetical protein